MGRCLYAVSEGVEGKGGAFAAGCTAVFPPGTFPGRGGGGGGPLPALPVPEANPLAGGGGAAGGPPDAFIFTALASRIAAAIYNWSIGVGSFRVDEMYTDAEGKVALPCQLT